MTPVQAGGDPFSKYITQQTLDDFKAMFPDDPDVAAITLPQLLAYAAGKNPDGSAAEITSEGGNVPRVTIDPLAIAIAGLIINLTLFIVGLIGIHAAFKRALLLKTAAALTDNQRYLLQPMILRAATAFQDERATTGDKALALFNLAKTFWTGGLITPLLKAFFHSLTTWDAVLYGALTLATLGAAFISAGAEFIALIAADAFQLGLVGSSLADVVITWRIEFGSRGGVTVAGGNGIGPALNQIQPMDLAFGLGGELFITDGTIPRVMRWTPGASSGTVIADRPTNGIGSAPGGGQGLLVAIAANGDVYISDTANNRVLCWIRTTNTVITVAGGNGVGPAANQLFWPGSIAVDANRNLFVLDVGNNRVQKWIPGATTGTTVAGGNGSGTAPNQVGGSVMALDKGGNIYISSTYPPGVQVWAPGATSGELVDLTAALASLPEPHRFAQVGGLTLDIYGNLYICDRMAQRILKFPPGRDLAVIVAGGNGEGAAKSQLSNPLGIIVADNGDVYVADVMNARVQRWSAH